MSLHEKQKSIEDREPSVENKTELEDRNKTERTKYNFETFQEFFTVFHKCSTIINTGSSIVGAYIGFCANQMKISEGKQSKLKWSIKKNDPGPGQSWVRNRPLLDEGNFSANIVDVGRSIQDRQQVYGGLGQGRLVGQSIASCDVMEGAISTAKSAARLRSVCGRGSTNRKR